MGSFPVNAPSPNANYLSLWGWNGQGNPPIDDPLSDFWAWWNLFNVNPYSAGTSYMDMMGGGGGNGKPYDPGWQGIVDVLSGAVTGLPPLLGGGGIETPTVADPSQPVETPAEPEGPAWPERPETPTGPLEEPQIDPGWLEKYPWLIGLSGAAAAAAIAALEAGGVTPESPQFDVTKTETLPTETPVPSEIPFDPALYPELAAILEPPATVPEPVPDFSITGWGTPDQVPFDPAPTDYPSPVPNPDFTAWGFATPEPVPYAPAPVDYGGIVPGAVPGVTVPSAPVNTETPTPKLPAGTPTATVSGGGGGAALPPGFPVVGDNSKLKSIFELPIAALPTQFIKALQLGGRR